MLWSLFPPLARRDAKRSLVEGHRAAREARHDDAALHFERALGAAREGWGRRHAEVIEPLTALAASLKLAGRFSESELYYAQALDDVDRGFASEEGWLAVHSDAAGVYWALGRLRTALHLFEKLEDRAIEGSQLAASARMHRAIGCRWLFEMEAARELAAGLPDTGGWPVTRRLLVGRTYALTGEHGRAAAEYRAGLTLIEPQTTYREAAFGSRTSPVPVIIASRLAVELHRTGDPDAARHIETVDRAMADLEEPGLGEALETVAFDRGELAEDPVDALAHHRQARTLRDERWGSTGPATTESRVRCMELGAEDDDRHELRSRLEHELGFSHPWVLRLTQ